MHHSRVVSAAHQTRSEGSLPTGIYSVVILCTVSSRCDLNSGVLLTQIRPRVIPQCFDPILPQKVICLDALVIHVPFSLLLQDLL